MVKEAEGAPSRPPVFIDVYPPAPIVSTPTFTIRPLHPLDAPALVYHANNPNVAANHTDSFPHPYDFSKAYKWLTTNAFPDGITGIDGSKSADGPAVGAKQPWPTSFAIALPGGPAPPSSERRENEEAREPTVLPMRQPLAPNAPGSLIGAIGIKYISAAVDVWSFSAELGYWVGEEYWNRGITTAATRAFLHWIFPSPSLPPLPPPLAPGAAEEHDDNAAGQQVEEARNLQLDNPAWPPSPYDKPGRRLIRLGAAVFGGNAASARVLEKSGFTREGTMRSAIVKKGKVMDLFIFSVLRDEVYAME